MPGKKPQQFDAGVSGSADDADLDHGFLARAFSNRF
jgi:hypothetical protein